MEGHWKFLGEGGVLKAKILEEMYENKLESPGGRVGGGGAKQKTFHGGSMDIFWNCTIVVVTWREVFIEEVIIRVNMVNNCCKSSNKPNCSLVGPHWKWWVSQSPPKLRHIPSTVS